MCSAVICDILDPVELNCYCKNKNKHQEELVF